MYSNNLYTGVYVISVMDGTNCTNAGVNVTISDKMFLPLPQLATATSQIIIMALLPVRGPGGTAPLEYSINGTVFPGFPIYLTI